MIVEDGDGGTRRLVTGKPRHIRYRECPKIRAARFTPADENEPLDMLTVSALAEDRRPLWDEYVRAHPHACVYHLSGWREVIRRSFGHECHYLMARNAAGKVVGVLPLTRINSRLFGHYMISLPYFTYGGPLADDATAESALLSSAFDIANTQGCRHVELRCQRQLPEQGGKALTLREDKVTMLLPIADTPEGLKKQISSQRRSQIRKAEANNPVIRVGGAEVLDDFYSCFAQNMRDLGTPVYSKTFFAEMLREFPDNIVLVGVRVDGRPAGAAFLIGFRDSMEVPWVSTMREFNPMHINALLYWELLKVAQSRGHKCFDFGRSTRDAGTYQFKRQWGAQPTQLYWHYWVRPGASMPNLTPHNPKLALAVRLWKHLPVPVANTLGPWIVRDLP
jgi:serine/alanine adding enzyme